MFIVNRVIEVESCSNGDQSGLSAHLFYNLQTNWMNRDAKSPWEAIKSRFGGNIESKKMQKNILKHQFENFSTTSNESLDKAYDSPQTENEDFQQMDEDDLEELDLRWQKGNFASECRSGRNQGRRSYGDNGRSNAPINESSSQALVAQDGLGGYD
ncbi:hypothetical protein Tco_0365313 [Tanacetum coccineum]